MIGITGSNLTDLGRNEIDADQAVGNELAAADQRNIQRKQLSNQMAQFLQELQFRQQQSGQQNALANNALAQQGRIADMQWQTPNATSTATNTNQFAMANLPYNKITPAQQAQLDLEKQAQTNALAIAKMPYDMAAQGIPIGNGPVAQAAGQMAIDRAQRAEKLDTAVKSANAAYLSTIPTFWQVGGWVRPGNEKVRHAQAVQTQLGGAMPEVNELLFDENANGGKGGFVSQDQPTSGNPFATFKPPMANTNANMPPAITGAANTNPPPLLSTNGQNQFLQVPAASKPLDAQTAQGFLQQAGGDPNKARAMATQAGFTF